MGRLFSCFLLSLVLLPAAKQPSDAQPVFFSMLFPQLMPQMEIEATAGEAVRM